jgi:hypothetical protein
MVAGACMRRRPACLRSDTLCPHPPRRCGGPKPPPSPSHCGDRFDVQQIFQQSRNLFVVLRPLGRHGHAAVRAMEKLHAHHLFQHHDGARNIGLRDPERPGRPCKGAQLHHAGEGMHGVNLVHVTCEGRLEERGAYSARIDVGGSVINVSQRQVPTRRPRTPWVPLRAGCARRPRPRGASVTR